MPSIVLSSTRKQSHNLKIKNEKTRDGQIDKREKEGREGQRKKKSRRREGEGSGGEGKKQMKSVFVNLRP